MVQKFMRAVGAAVGLAIIFGASGQASATAVFDHLLEYRLWPRHSLVRRTAQRHCPGPRGNRPTGCQIGNLATNNVSGTGVFCCPGQR